MRQIVKKYELLVIDLWGVIHDGSHAYPGVLDSIEYLQKQHKKIVFLSNAPRRAQKTKILLDQLGITTDKYEKLLTSGEIAFEYLSKLGEKQGSKKYYFIGPDRDLDVMSESMHSHTNDPKEADFVIASGYELGEGEEVKDRQLQESYDAGLFMYCFNPDLEIHKHDGSVHHCAGLLARKYQQLGGKVKLFGKPIADTYRYIRDLYQVAPEKILCIGDNMATDIKGAVDHNLDSVLICWGIPAMYMGIAAGDVPNAKQVAEFLGNYDMPPTYISARF